MKKQLIKLIASILSLTAAATLVAMTSYAWLTISSAPEVDGIQVNIGGSDTVMVAADIAVSNADGSVTHFPGEFRQSMKFSEWESYAYLKTLKGLAPVSTADGVHWVLPDYYTAADAKVENGQAMIGQLKDITEFSVDSTLQYANVAANTQDAQSSGHYVYVDFWVVAPVEGYRLRVSTGKDAEDTGSFVITRMEPTEQADGQYVLDASDDTAAAAVRVGFLVNKNWAPYADALSYAASSYYDQRYPSLMGSYPEPGDALADFSAVMNRFTLYEPNGDLHTDDHCSGYYLTEPLGVTNGVIHPVSVEDRLSVQLQSRWKCPQGQTQTLLEQEFTTALFGKDTGEMTKDEVSRFFYQQRLQGLVSRYINRGRFIESTGKLYDAAVDGGVALDSAALTQLAGATEDTHITILEKDVPQRIRMFIWIEGQDIDCANQKTASNLIVNLEFAGSNH